MHGVHQARAVESQANELVMPIACRSSPRNVTRE